MTLLITPLMSAWMRNRIATRAALLLPSDGPFVTVAGSDPDRIALVGSGAAAGIGVRSHETALAGTVARALSQRTRRGATVESFGRPDCGLDAVPELIGDARLSRYDAVVVLAGLEDAIAMRTPRSWRRGLTRVLDRVRAEAALDTTVLVLGIPQVSAIGIYAGIRGRVADRHASVLNRATKSITEVREHVRYAPLSLPRGHDPHDEIAAAAWYEAWGEDIAAALAPVLAPADDRPVAARSIRAAPEVESERVGALDRTGFVRGERDGRFDRIAAMAHELVGGDVAAVGFLDEDTHWYSSVVGFDLVSMSRSDSICDRTVQQEGPFVVGDLQQDRSYEGNPVVWTEGMRFYAGFPIESADGYRIGTICVLGREPRDPSTVDVDALRRLAGLARTAVWESTRTGSAPAPAGFPVEPIRVS